MDVENILADAQAKYDADEMENALAILDEAIETEKSNADLFDLRGQVYIELDDLRGALRDLNRAVKLGGKVGKYLTTRAQLLIFPRFCGQEKCPIQ